MQSGHRLLVVNIAEWQKWRKSNDHELVNLLAMKHAELNLRALMMAAAKRNRAEALFVSFQEWLEGTIGEFGIENSFKTHMEEQVRHWNAGMKSRSHLLLVDPEILTGALQSAARIAARIDSRVKAGHEQAEKWTVGALQAAFDEPLQQSLMASS